MKVALQVALGICVVTLALLFCFWGLAGLADEAWREACQSARLAGYQGDFARMRGGCEAAPDPFAPSQQMRATEGAR